MSETSATESLLRRDRLIVGACLALICLLSWYYLLMGAGTGMGTVAMTTWEFPPPVYKSSGAGQWSASYWLIMFVMWWVMMIAMMVPSATPMILLYARVQRHAHKQGQGEGVIPVLSFLLAAGIYQLSPLKGACLDHCRSPAEFLSSHWRKGRAGALRMGVDHGLYCVGCCWFLMLLLFVGGTMNLVWIAGLAIFVLLEKLLPRGDLFARSSGGLMLLLGVYLLIT
jgi:predicted metal-binding membrane protein